MMMVTSRTTPHTDTGFTRIFRFNICTIQTDRDWRVDVELFLLLILIVDFPPDLQVQLSVESFYNDALNQW